VVKGVVGTALVVILELASEKGFGLRQLQDLLEVVASINH
jgi:hypothetical protein